MDVFCLARPRLFKSEFITIRCCKGLWFGFDHDGKFLEDHNRPKGATNSCSPIPDAHSMQLLELAIGLALSLFRACASTLKRSATAVPRCQTCFVLKHCSNDLLEVVEPLMLEMSEVGLDRRPTKSILKAIAVYPGRIANQRSTRMA